MTIDKPTSPLSAMPSVFTGTQQATTASTVSGVLELHPKGYGFLRDPKRNLRQQQADVFVPASLIDKHSMKQGHWVEGEAKPGKGGSRRLVRTHLLEGQQPRSATSKNFEECTPKNPTRWLQLENESQPVSMRILDLLCPVGLGQRALIAAPPRAGKTTLLKQIAKSIALNHPDVHLKMLLIDERPEEVTEMREDTSAEVFSSDLDRDAKSHARLTRLVIDRCKRLAENGQNVFLIVDSLTRMARAFNKLPGQSGPTGAGGLNIHALDLPKRAFSVARSFAEGGSITVVASVLIDTSNRMDEVIFREFKGTGNLDIVLDPQLADHRVWPAIDIAQTATRREELIHDTASHQAATSLRRVLLKMPKAKAMQELATKLTRFEDNEAFVSLINGVEPNTTFSSQQR